MRTLALHASALSDAEYDFFTKSLREIADDDIAQDDGRYERISIGIREARAWFRGRYSRLSLSVIDGILQLFAPNLAREDVINGTEFFAALRLVTHADNGREIDRSLAFVQVNPPLYAPSSVQKDSRSPSPPARVAEFLRPPSPSTDSARHSALNPFIRNKLPPLPPRKTSINSPAPPPPPRHLAASFTECSISPSSNTAPSPPLPTKPSHHVTSTLIKQSLQARKIAQSLKKAEEQLDKERVLQVLKSSSIVTGAYPLAGASIVGSSVVIGTNIHNQLQNHPPDVAPKRLHCSSTSSGSEGGHRPRLPPLPKRRSGHPSPPMSDGSLEQVALASSLPHPGSSTANTYSHPTSSSNPFSKDDLSNHPLPAPPPTHPDRNPTFGYHQLNPSPKPTLDAAPRLTTQNLETFEAIYGSMAISPFRSASGGSNHGRLAFPPNSDTIINTDSQTRPYRSQSLSHHSPVSQAPLPPPARRKRPESVLADTPRSLSGRGSRGVGHRKSSLSLSSVSSFRSRTSSPFTDDNTPHQFNSGASTNSVAGSHSTSGVVGTNIQRTIDALHHIHGQLQPKLEKARYKAEAGLSKRGYVRSSVRSSGEESPTAVETEEQESLTREHDSQKAKGRWPETHIEAQVDESGSDESEWTRGRSVDISGSNS